ncbi:3-keto-disaccharide hydrolase [Planctomicrobium sp. SH668]|uniref:3-keto-disaccharide hydrolase n=1 Tax=Planctomicrobium sp. SH668 TaxID=3448126 RepID=UPI003F5C411B
MKRCWTTLPLAFMSLLLVLSQGVFANESAVALFNGNDLTGWTQRGGKAIYTVEGDEIVGTSVANTGNSFLSTDKMYSNFVLELDFKVDEALNSGIQIRSNQFPTEKVWKGTGKEGEKITATVPADRVHGYQVEIDPSERAWTGGIYDEGRRGWLFNLVGDQHAEARNAFKQDEWNHFRIEANGDEIKTWINGKPAADLKDDMTKSGFIALQVHGIGDDAKKIGKQIRWKNIQLTELPSQEVASTEEQTLFFKGKEGPGAGKKIVLISGDEEYRSEQALTQLAKILSERHGFDCTVLFAIDPNTGYINPNVTTNIPGLEALDSADLMFIFTRFRNLPEEQMQHIDDYLKTGKPVIGIRTATHAFNIPGNAPYARYSNGYLGDQKEWADGFGRLVLGERWHTHHGDHMTQSTYGVIAEGQQEHPILRGIKDGDIWGSTDVYGVRLPLPGDSQPLVLGKVMHRDGPRDDNDLHYGLRPTDSKPDDSRNKPLMPIVWLKTFEVPGGKPGKSMTSTIGASSDLVIEGVRREFVNGVYFLLGLSDQIPADGTNVEIVGEYKPDAYRGQSNEYWNEKKLKPSDLR